ncbi:MAG: alpha/beta hydrolase [archaeon]
MVKTKQKKKKKGEANQEVIRADDAAGLHDDPVEKGDVSVKNDQSRRLPGPGVGEGQKNKAKEKSIIKRLFIIGLAAAVLLLIIFFVSSKIRFIFSDELNMRVSPLQQSFSVTNRDAVVANITLVNSNFIQCRSQCKFTLTNLADESIIYSSNESVKHNEQLNKQFIIRMPGKGSGQLLYMFESECINLRSVVCLTDENPHYKSSMIIINYGLTAEEAHAKELMQQSLDGFRRLLSEVSALHEENLILSRNLPSGAVENQALISSLEINQQALDRFRIRSQALTSLWDQENYLGLMNSFSGEELSALLSLKDEVSKMRKEMIALIEARNKNIELLQKTSDYAADVREMALRYRNESNPQNSLLLAKLNSVAEDISRNYIFISTGTVHSEGEIGKALEDDLQNLSVLAQDLDLKKAEEAFLLIYGSNLLRQKGININSSVSSGCAGLRGLASNIALTNVNSSLRRAYDYNWSIGNESFDQALKMASINIALQALNKSREQVNLQASGGPYNMTVINRTRIIMMIDAEEARLNADLVGLGAAEEIGLESLKSLVMINGSMSNEYIIMNCAAANHSSTGSVAGIIAFLSIPFSSILDLRASSEVTVINASLPGLGSNPAQCCVFGKCTPCCSEPGCRGAISPVIFIHGHVFNDANTPEYSMNSFTKIQRKMMSDGFISFGELDLKANKENASFGEWSESRVPATVRVSYYYITYYTLADYSVAAQKTESIESYALRLKEIIDLVKYKTGSNKVSIVAHSMGGLVAREYTSLFGYDDLSKLILVNTPNSGVSGKVKDFCSVLGAKKECGEMAEGSIFLSRLNVRKIPADAMVYAIRSTGCEMDGNRDGDGIVTAESAYLEGAKKNYEIKGNCTGSFKDSLHSDSLNPEKYPETYDLILSILTS